MSGGVDWWRRVVRWVVMLMKDYGDKMSGGVDWWRRVVRWVVMLMKDYGNKMSGGWIGGGVSFVGL